MRFSVDAHAIGRHLTGNEVYVRSLLNSFGDVDKESEFIAYLSVSDARAAIPARFLVRRVAANPFVRLGFDLVRRLRLDRPQLVHVQYTAPLACPVPVVASVHDVSFLEHPEYFPPARDIQLRWSVKRTVLSAARILTGSEFSRASIVRAYGEAADRVVVIPNAAAAGFRPLNRDAARRAVESRFRIAGPFILSVGDLQPRKNHAGLIEAFARFVRSNPQLPHRLVLAGKDTWFAGKVHTAARESGVADRIHFAGFVSDEELLQLYNASEFFVFPSFYEGFGLPVLEAMACGRAVACSGVSAILEVADGAALLFDPHKVDDIARALVDLARDAELRTRMERLGAQRATQFSWKKTAQKTLEVYREVAEGASPRPKLAQVRAAASLDSLR